MTESYVTAAAIMFGAVAVGTSVSVAAALRRPTVAASVHAYEFSKWAFVAVLALLAALFFIHVVPTYRDLVELFLVDLACWRLTANYAIRRRDVFAELPATRGDEYGSSIRVPAVLRPATSPPTRAATIRRRRHDTTCRPN